MRTVNNFIVEIDPEYLNMTNGVYTPTIGSKFERLPKHGTVTTAPKDGLIKEGDVLYFIHYALDTRWEQEGKTYLSIEPDLVLGYSKVFAKNIKSFSHVITKRIEREHKGRIITELGINHHTQKFEVTHCNKKTIERVKKGEVLWVWKDSDYSLNYLPEVVFLEPDKIIMNEGTEELLNGYVLIDTLDEEDSYELVGGLYLPMAEARVKGMGRIRRCNENVIFKDGDKVIYKKTSFSKVDGKLNAVKFEEVRCYETS